MNGRAVVTLMDIMVQKLRIIPRMNGRTNIKLSTDRFHDEVLMLNIIVQNVKTLSVDNSNIITSSPTAVT